MKAFSICSGVPLPDREAGSGLLRRIVNEPALLGIEIRRASGGCRRAKGPNHIMGVRNNGSAQHRFHGAHAEIVTERHGAQEMRAVNAECLRDGKCGRRDSAPRMRPTRAVVIVGLVGLSQCSVYDRGLDRAAERVGRDNRRDFPATIGTRKLQGLASGRQFGSGDHGGESVQHMILCLFDNLGRDRPAAGLAHIGAELGHHRAGVFCSCVSVVEECGDGETKAFGN
jgi:hypothetical protein